MSRRRPLPAPPAPRGGDHTVRIVCTGPRRDPHRERLVTTLRVSSLRVTINGETHLVSRTDGLTVPRDSWSDLPGEQQPHYRRGWSDPADWDGSWRKVALRCPVPACRPVLEAGPELADRLADALVESGLRRVGLRDLVSLAARLSTSSRSVTGDAADL